jgi:predicted acylesterase/phospholipase RssA
VAQLGCINWLQEHGHIKSLIRCIGTSAGSVVAFLLTLRFSVDEIIASINEFLTIQRRQPFDMDTAFDVFQTLGFDDATYIQEFLCAQWHKKYPACAEVDMTFLELAKLSGRDLVVCACRLPQLEPEYFCVDKTPNMSVARAILASCSIPLLMTPVMIGGDMYIDGGLSSNFPCSYVSGGATGVFKDALGICVQDPEFSFDVNETNLFNYIQVVIESLINRANVSNDDEQKNDAVIDMIRVVVPARARGVMFDADTLSFDISPDMIKELLDCGYKAACAKFIV